MGYEQQQQNPRKGGDIQAIERGLLGSLITNPDLIDATRIKREWFTQSEAWTVIEALDALAIDGRSITVPNLVAKLRDLTGGHDFMQSVLKWKDSAIPESQVQSKVDFLKREFALREASRVLREIHETVKNGTFSADSAMERLYSAVTVDDESKHSYTAAEAAKVSMTQIIANLEASSGTGITGITTGIPVLDKITGGFQKGDLIIVAGRPSMGKTSVDIGFQVAALDAGHKTGFISAEMPVEKVTARMMAAKGKFNLQITRSMPTDQAAQAIAINKLKNANNWYAKQSHYTNDKAGISLAEVSRQARQWKRLYDIESLHVDYTQFLTIDADARTPKHERVGDIVKGLKRLAKELKIPVIALSQVSRAVEERANKRPMMSDLSDASEIEKTADLIITLYRDEVYNPESQDKGIIELGVIKQRDGQTGTVRAAWLGESATVADLDMVHGGGYDHY